MNTRNSLYSLFFLVFLTVFSCEKENALECPSQHDKAIDIIAGPGLGGITMAYLTNQYGGLQDEQYVSAYPLFMNWLGGCQETYTVNLLSKNPLFSQPGQSIRERFSLFSFFDVEHGKTTDFRFNTPYYGGSVTGTEPFVITISGVALVEEIVILPAIDFSLSSNPSAQTINISFPQSAIQAKEPWRYIGLRMPGASDLIAVSINMLNDDSRVININQFDQVLSEKEILFTGAEVESAEVKIVLNSSEEKMVILGVQSLEEQKVSAWIPETLEGVMLKLSSASETTASWEIQEYYEELPTEIVLQPRTITSVVEDGGFIDIQLNKPGYLSFLSATNPFLDTYYLRTLAGTKSSGRTRIRIPKVAGEFSSSYPETVYLDHLLEENGFKVALYHYPAAQSLDQYKRLTELSWLDRQRYLQYELRVEK